MLIVGCGYVGNALAARMLAGGWAVAGLRRQVAGLLPGVQPIEADLHDARLVERLPRRAWDAVVVCAAAGRDAAAYRRTYQEGIGNVVAALRQHAGGVGRLLYTSSTGVYREAAGGWVDEAAPTGGTLRRDALQAAEAAILGWPGSTVVRFAGIYGPERYLYLEAIRSGRAVWPTQPHWTNRVHRADCVGSLAHLLEGPAAQPIYNVADPHPADKHAVMQYLAEQAGQPSAPPPRGGTPQGKRCSSARLVASGYRFAYPSYREGYRAAFGN